MPQRIGRSPRPDRKPVLMPIYPLGVIRRRDVPSPAERLAVGSADVRWNLTGELACAFVDAPHNALKPMHHAAALEAIHRRTCVLPLRFGVALRDEDEIRALLQSRHHELFDRLGRLDWTCEMALRIMLPKAPKTRSAASSKLPSPLAHVRRHRPHQRLTDPVAEQTRRIVQRFVEHLHGTYRDWRKLPSLPSEPIRLSFLVERDRVEAFRGRLEHIHGMCRRVRWIVLGPWPPYNFV